MSTLGNILKGIGKGIVGLLPGGGTALMAIEGVEAIGNVIGGEAGKLITNGATQMKAGLAKADTDNMPPEIRAECLKEKNRHREAMRAHELKEKQIMTQADLDAAAQTTERATELEGSAKDLLKLPVVGRIVIFLRGAQRPVWGYMSLFMDYQILSGKWEVQMTVPETGAYTAEGCLIIAINVLVLGFLFGERTIKNILPLVTRFLEARGLAAPKGAA